MSLAFGLLFLVQGKCYERKEKGREECRSIHEILNIGVELRCERLSKPPPLPLVSSLLIFRVLRVFEVSDDDVDDEA